MTACKQTTQEQKQISNHSAGASRPVEEALKNSELRYRRLFETAQDGILILDADIASARNVNRVTGNVCVQLRIIYRFGRSLRGFSSNWIQNYISCLTEAESEVVTDTRRIKPAYTGFLQIGKLMSVWILQHHKPLLHSQLGVVAGGGIEPPTQGFSVLCSTN